MKKILIVCLFLVFMCGVQAANGADRAVVIPLFSTPFKGDMYHTVPAANFVPITNSYEYSYVPGLYLLLPPAGGVFLAPLSLPHGVKMSEIALAAADLGGGQTITVLVYKKNIITGEAAVAIPSGIALNSSSLAIGEYGFQTLAIEDVIDNENYQYFIVLIATGAPSDLLYAVRFKYRL